MSGATVARVLEMIQQLDPDELRQVQRAVEARLKQQDEAAALEAFHQALVASGLVKTIKRVLPRSDEGRPLVPIQGKPLSETIIEERR